MNNVTFIVLCSGNSKRFGSQNKIFSNINGKKVIEILLERIIEFSFAEIIISIKKIDLPKLGEILNQDKFINCNFKISYGGRTRQISSENAVAKANFPFVMIHDGARPFLQKKVIQEILNYIPKYDAIIPVLKLNDTLKMVNKEFVQKTLDRKKFVLVQTPQCFKKSLIQTAFLSANKAGDFDNYDDSVLIEKYTKKRVKTIDGSYLTEKITVPLDIERISRYE
ncbi:hypothetical protein ASO20_01665 [Mycoplasma sp. (ex Biomphalaria glabrata)]|uniref:2-C-methyl-D-erythritol 4-phosphate cytidylyltransferase n=1 Tax=Mycoplasma sp. (ex Biomphalaria glabrata) TaxID=1749074 RepID=UPI00073A62DB|nr:2-C-methyl-D-erythritol 4-phosphate cytidylyltransferase [Mycoplasma sp. (ex Biomphalaria glabrata)]ALV23355.1 hypothetical protein ASO20_01665 [Mycoplasma sp. (ex Biomphalaria glabrata)]